MSVSTAHGSGISSRSLGQRDCSDEKLGARRRSVRSMGGVCMWLLHFEYLIPLTRPETQKYLFRCSTSFHIHGNLSLERFLCAPYQSEGVNMWPILMSIAVAWVTMLIVVLLALPTTRGANQHGRTSVQIVVLGDLGRSPRMQYHASSILKHGGDVQLIGYQGEQMR